MSIGDIGVMATVTIGLVTGVWAVMKVAAHQFDKALETRFGAVDKRLDERFATMETARVEAKRDWDRRFDGFGSAQRELEREFARFQAALPRDYWRREDAIRNDTVIDAKLDAMNARFDHFIALQKMCPLTPSRTAPAAADSCVTVLREAQVPRVST